MSTLVNVIIATTTAFLISPVVGDQIPVEPLPLVSLTITKALPPEEEKPLPNPEPTVKESACNCYNILKETFKDVPSMETLLSLATTSGNVAIMKYPATPDFPNGIPHVALVRAVLPDGSYEIEEYNYKRCTHSTRIIPANYHRLVGFTTLDS